MATKAQPVKLGPFAGGLNTNGDASAIADDECSELINFDVDIDGSLVSRPAITTLFTMFSSSTGLRLLGIYTQSNGTNWLIFTRASSGTSNPTGTYAFNLGASGEIVGIDTFAATAMVQYQNRAWLISPIGSDNLSGSWDGTTFTPVAAIPHGAAAVIYKERLFVATGAGSNPSRIYFSNAADPTKWTGTDFFDVHNGDGQRIVTLYTYAGSIVIFKTNSTFIFAYESAPAKGQVQIVSASIGIDGRDCITEADNILYVMNNTNVYSITNWTWEQLNLTVPFQFNKDLFNVTQSASICRVGNRIIARYYDNHYVYNIQSGVWSQWNSTRPFDFFIPSPIDSAVSSRRVYYAGNYYKTNVGYASDVFILRDGFRDTDTDVEKFTCSMSTKTISLNSPQSYKRLMWWGVDTMANAPMDGIVRPVAYNTPVRWKNITDLGLKWSDRANYTWGHPLNKDISVTDRASLTNYADIRLFVKFTKSLRFRQAQFSLTSNIDGTARTGPLRIFSITAYVINKETVNTKIS